MKLFQPKDAYRTSARRISHAAEWSARPESCIRARWSTIRSKKTARTKSRWNSWTTAGKLIRKFSSKVAKRAEARAGDDEEDEDPPRPAGADRVPAEVGFNRFVWDLRYPDATTFPGPDHVGRQHARTCDRSGNLSSAV